MEVEIPTKSKGSTPSSSSTLFESSPSASTPGKPSNSSSYTAPKLRSPSPITCCAPLLFFKVPYESGASPKSEITGGLKIQFRDNKLSTPSIELAGISPGLPVKLKICPNPPVL